MSNTQTKYQTGNVNGLSVFYREAGDQSNPTIVLLSGYPSSSFMYRELIPLLAANYHVIAPDYPGFGHSETPSTADFAYTFDHLSEVIESFLQTLRLDRFAMYVQDYGAPVGFRIAARHPEWISAIIVQNGNAYEEGFTPAWKDLRTFWGERNEQSEAAVASLLSTDVVKFFYQHGTRNPAALSPDTWTLDLALLERPTNKAAQLELFYDYRNNPPQYPGWHQYFREHQPPTLLIWGKNDPFFGPDGATAFLKDIPNAELHFLDTGHFALEEDYQVAAELIVPFLAKVESKS